MCIRDRLKAMSEIIDNITVKFIDSLKDNLKAVLLYNGNKFHSVPLPHSTNMKETYENMKLILDKTHYEKYS